MFDWAGQRPEVRNFLHEIRSKVRSGGLLDNDAVQQAYEAGCFCLSQLQLAGFGSVQGSAAPGERHETTAHPHDREHPWSYPGGAAWAVVSVASLNLCLHILVLLPLYDVPLHFAWPRPSYTGTPFATCTAYRPRQTHLISNSKKARQPAAMLDTCSSWLLWRGAKPRTPCVNWSNITGLTHIHLSVALNTHSTTACLRLRLREKLWDSMWCHEIFRMDRPLTWNKISKHCIEVPGKMPRLHLQLMTK